MSPDTPDREPEMQDAPPCRRTKADDPTAARSFTTLRVEKRKKPTLSDQPFPRYAEIKHLMALSSCSLASFSSSIMYAISSSFAIVPSPNLIPHLVAQI